MAIAQSHASNVGLRPRMHGHNQSSSQAKRQTASPDAAASTIGCPACACGCLWIELEWGPWLRQSLQMQTHTRDRDCRLTED